MGGHLSKEEHGGSGMNHDDGNLRLAETSSFATLRPTINDETTNDPSSSKDSNWKLENIFGNTEELSSSAQRVIAMGKCYLTGRALDATRKNGFSSLFQVLPKSKPADLTGNMEKETDGNQPDGKNNDSVFTYADGSNCEPVFTSPGGSLTSIKQSQIEQSSTNPAKLIGMQCAQTFAQWKASHDLLNLNYLCFSRPKTIYIQPLDNFPDLCMAFRLHTHNMTLGFFDMLQGFMQIFFSGMEVMIIPPVSINERAWNVRSRYQEVTKQKQYCVTDLFPYLKTLLPRNGHSIVGIVWTDLYPEHFNFVLGEASYAHKSAVISFGRFEPSNYHAESHKDVSEINGHVIWKLLRTLSHEVCHLFGLSHCLFFYCAMNESSSVPEALSQPLFLCPVCLHKLQQACGFDVLPRYQLLLKFLQNITNDFSDCVEIQDSVVWLENCVQFLIS